MTPLRLRTTLQSLKVEYEQLKPGKRALLRLVDESEIPESVYNSNAIENSTLTLEDTEAILLAAEVSKHMNIREVFEAQNLARVTNYISDKSSEIELSIEMLLLLHRMLMSNIVDDVAGRFQGPGEFVRVGTHIAPPPDQVEDRVQRLIANYESTHSFFFVDRIAAFHLGFENTHPFVDGNGRIGRVLVNLQLLRLGFPPVIVRNKEKTAYYAALRDYDRDNNKTREMETLLALALCESLAKRVAYLRGREIVNLTHFARANGKSTPALLNAARRQTIRAFREHGHWKISDDELQG